MEINLDILEDKRRPLPEGHVIRMKSGAEYVIRREIGCGGFSLIYDADTDEGTVSMVIKEFYPDGVAKRDQDGNIVSLMGAESEFERDFDLFKNEVKLGGKLADQSYQILPLVDRSDCGIYAAMKKYSRDMISIRCLVHRWDDRGLQCALMDRLCIDPVYPDLHRLGYALRITESLLTVLSQVHTHGCLHLDISSNNVIWAGEDLDTGRNCAAFLADFGCARKLTDGYCEVEGGLDATRDFRAPETWKTWPHLKLSPATDLYSVGVLLYFLCTGQSNLYGKEWRTIHRHLMYRDLPERMRDQLEQLLRKATEEKMSMRFQSADEMKTAVQELEDLIPQHPINPAYTDSFTLNSLRSMLEGSKGSHYSWAHELKDRRKVSGADIPDQVYEPVTDRKFADDMDFLKKILPEEIFPYISDRAASDINPEHVVNAFMTGKYDSEYRADICRLLQESGMRRMLIICRSLLNHENTFFTDQKLLFQLLGEEGTRLKSCYYNCGGGDPPYVGLAMFTVYALLGPDGFAQLVPSPSRAGAGKLFHPVRSI